ncbi:MAG: S8 family serine peptidase, partial [Pirellulaceae bacterium]|nr:S8 family serine peptidase [Pirellulaceae bacterium]
MQLGYLEGQAVLKLRESMDRGAQSQFLEALRLREHYYYPSIGAFWVKFDRSRPVTEVITMLRGHADVEWVHENAIGHRTQTFPNDPNFSKCYALHNTGQTIGGSVGTNDADMDMPEAWDLLTDATNVIIAIIDSGARLTHQDLSSNIWVNPGEIANNSIDDDGNGKIDDINGWAFDNNNNNPNDNDGHGTNVSGCTAARGNNGIGTTGVCWKANLMICKDGDASPSVAASAAGMEYAAMNGAVVANFSTGYGSGNYSVLQAAVNTAQNYGMIICVAAGNSNTNLNNSSDAPATYTNDNLLVVGASNNDDGKASFSSYGNIHVDVAAAGVDVYTTRRNSNSSYGYVDGTSFSAPLTTGVVGLIRAYNTSASYQTVRSAVINTCDAASAWSGKCASNGRVNCFAAMQLVGPGGGGGGNSLNPNPMTFASAPAPQSESSISMVATTASTQAGDPVEYQFGFTSSLGSGGSSSGWQSSTSYTDSLLDPNRSYGFTITARNATTQAAGTVSAESTAVTHAAVPELVTLANVTPTGFTIGDIDLNGNPTTTAIAIEVDGQFLSFNGTLSANPQWLPKQAWTFSSGPTVASTTNIAVRAKARNLAGVETAFGPSTGSGGGGTSTLGACGAGNVIIVGGGF